MCRASEFDHQRRRPALHRLAALLEDLLQVAGELEGQGVQAVLRLLGKGGHSRGQGGVVQPRRGLLQLGQVLVHGDGVQGLVAGQHSSRV